MSGRSPRLRRRVRRTLRVARRRFRQRHDIRVLRVSLDRCITLAPIAFVCGTGSRDPLTRTLQAFAAGDCTGFEDSPLRDYLACWHPASLAEVVGIPDADASEALRAAANGTLPPLPWARNARGTRAAERLRRRDFVASAERLGVDPTTQWGSMLYGPASDGLGQVTFATLVGLYESIARRGYRAGRPGRPHIGARLLVRGDEYRVLVSSGKHRAAALSALGYDTIPVMIGAKIPVVVDRDDADAWPNVLAGIYTPDQARAVFDRMFDGRQPAGLREAWPTDE